MNDIIEKLLPKNPILKSPLKINEEPKKFGLLMYSNEGKMVCSHVMLDILDRGFHKSLAEAETMLLEYQTKTKVIVYTGSLDVVSSKLSEAVPFLMKTLRTNCGGGCSLLIKSIQL